VLDALEKSKNTG